MNKTPLKSYTLIEHFHELKLRIIYCLIWFIICFVISYLNIEKIYDFLIEPLRSQWIAKDKHMIYTGLTEIFFSYLKLAYYSALFLSVPFWLCQVYIFVAPGLYKAERNAILPFLISAPLLFLFGILFVYYFIFPLAWQFFLTFGNHFNNGLEVKFEARVSEYLTLVLSMMFAFGMAFQMPIVLALLTKIGIITVESLIKKRRVAVVLIFILAAILTPPDAISQIALAIPMIILYEISIIICKKRDKEK